MELKRKYRVAEAQVEKTRAAIESGQLPGPPAHMTLEAYATVLDPKASREAVGEASNCFLFPEHMARNGQPRP